MRIPIKHDIDDEKDGLNEASECITALFFLFFFSMLWDVLLLQLIINCVSHPTKKGLQNINGRAGPLASIDTKN